MPRVDSSCRQAEAGKQAEPGSELIPGTLDLLILQVIAGGALHGYGVARAIRAASREAILVEEGTLYPALRRLEKRGLVEGAWRASESNRRARYYTLTADGRAHLASETERWRRASAAVEWVLGGGSLGEAGPEGVSA